MLKELSSSLAVLSSMITPAVLILASGSLILTTSQRLGRIIERVRRISEQFEKLTSTVEEKDKLNEQRKLLSTLLINGAKRSKLLQKSLTSLYLALSVFVATSITIGFLEILKLDFYWIPLILGMFGAGMLFYSSVIMVLESRIAISSVDEEMNYAIKSGNLKSVKL